jgi:hypothetical protein
MLFSWILADAVVTDWGSWRTVLFSCITSAASLSRAEKRLKIERRRERERERERERKKRTESRTCSLFFFSRVKAVEQESLSGQKRISNRISYRERRLNSVPKKSEREREHSMDSVSRRRVVSFIIPFIFSPFLGIDQTRDWLFFRPIPVSKKRRWKTRSHKNETLKSRKRV